MLAARRGKLSLAAATATATTAVTGLRREDQLVAMAVRALATAAAQEKLFDKILVRPSLVPLPPQQKTNPHHRSPTAARSRAA